jgi:multidrug efflux pump subunit AcrA (membrane-fusion protein)
MAPRLLPSLSLSAQVPVDTSADIPVQVNAAPTVAPVLTPGPGQAAVNLGSISDTLTLNGRVAGTDEAVVNFTASGTVSAVDAKLGDTVHQGDVLAETDMQDLKHQLAQAQGELETAAVRYSQAQAQAAADSASAQHDAAQTARDSATQRQSVVDDAQAALHRAQANLAKVQAGPADSDVRAAQAAVNTAQLALQKAQSDLAKVQSGPDRTAVNAAQAQVDIAQSDYDKQSATLDALTRGPDQNAVRSAQRDVDLATAGLKAAQAIPIDPKDPHADKARADKDVQIATAQATLANAQDKLAALQQPANSADVAIARSNAQAAKTKLDGAKQALAATQAGPDDTAVSQAQSAVDNAQLSEQNAEDHLNDVMSHPTPQEVQAAQDQVNAAQAALQRASQVGTSVGGGTSNSSNVGTSYNIVLLEKEVARDQALVDSITDDLNNTKVTAPFDGIITRVQVHVGDKLTRDAPIMTIAHPGAAIVEVDPTNADTARIAVGQTASVTFAGTPDPIDGRVAAIKDAPSGQNNKIVQIEMDWGASQIAPYGAVGQVQIQVNQKDGVLVVPKKAVHSAGSRKYVQVQTSSGRKIVTVEVGIVSSDSAEITSGLTQGQIVFVGP